MGKTVKVNFGRMDQEPKLVKDAPVRMENIPQRVVTQNKLSSPNVRAALERDRRMAYSIRYGQARKEGFSAADADLHAKQAQELWERENGYQSPAGDSGDK